MNYNKRIVDAYCNHVVKVSQGTPTTLTINGESCKINHATDISSYVQNIQGHGQYKYEVMQEADFTDDDIMLGMVFRRVQRNGVKMAPGTLGIIYHIRSYGKSCVYIGAGTLSATYKNLAEDYEYAIDFRALNAVPNPVLEWKPAKKTSPHYEFSPTYDSLMAEPPAPFSEDDDDDL